MTHSSHDTLHSHLDCCLHDPPDEGVAGESQDPSEEVALTVVDDRLDLLLALLLLLSVFILEGISEHVVSCPKELSQQVAC